MRKLVPTLVVTGWMDFFLDLRLPMGLTHAQIRQLSLIQKSYVTNLQRQGPQLNQAELNLYEDMESDVVRSAALDDDLQTIANIKTSIAEAHFTAVLEAINVLNHRQHLQADKWLKLSLERSLREKPAELPLRPNPFARLRDVFIGPRQKRGESRGFHWSSSFTPQQLLWKAW